MSMNQASLDFIRTLVAQRAAIILDASKGYLVQARLLPLARKLGLQNIDELVFEVRRNPSGPIGDRVVDAMTTNETSFFRDVMPFEALREDILPQLLRTRATARRINIWCAACSTGQEPYSIAMLLRSRFASLRDWDIRILASDISQRALAQATTGCYGDVEIQRGLSPDLRDRFFVREDGGWRVCEEIRRMVQFFPLNLVTDWPPLPLMDIVLLRNVMVYFAADTKRLLLSRVRNLLAGDGYLFLGGAETTMLLDDAFVRVTRDRFTYFQLRSAASNG
jgi:chemotaxis protein methyltransferase CheR